MERGGARRGTRVPVLLPLSALHGAAEPGVSAQVQASPHRRRCFQPKVSCGDRIRTWHQLKGATRPNEGDGFLFCVFVLSDAPSVRASALRVFKRDVGFHLITTAVHHIMRISQNRSDFEFVRCAKAACGSRTNNLLMSCEPGLPNHRRRSHFSSMEISCCQAMRKGY